MNRSWHGFEPLTPFQSSTGLDSNPPTSNRESSLPTTRPDFRPYFGNTYLVSLIVSIHFYLLSHFNKRKGVHSIILFVFQGCQMSASKLCTLHIFSSTYSLFLYMAILY